MKFLSLAAALALTACAPMTYEAAPPSLSDYAAALAAADRPEAEVARDSARKPAEVLAFAGVRPGEAVGDFIMGGGYFTRVLSAAVGPEGHVYAFQPNEFIAYRPAYAAEQDSTVAALANTDGVRGPVSAPPLFGPLDRIITIQNFHDLFLDSLPQETPAKAAASLFQALKPGGTLVVIDHAGAPGSGREAADKLHRIDKALVVETLTAVGFVLDGESDLFANPEDQHDLLVFNPAIRGKTDQFALRFRKPG